MFYCKIYYIYFISYFYRDFLVMRFEALTASAAVPGTTVLYTAALQMP